MIELDWVSESVITRRCQGGNFLNDVHDGMTCFIGFMCLSWNRRVLYDILWLDTDVFGTFLRWGVQKCRIKLSFRDAGKIAFIG